MGVAELQTRPFFGRPWAWLVFAIVMIAIPVVGYMVKAGLPWDEVHPALNAMLNGSSTVFLVAGWLAIRSDHTAFHRACMVSAFTASTAFLVSYLIRFAISGAHKYPGTGWDKTVYLIVLASHSLLALVVLPMVIRSLWLGWKGRYAEHRRIARWTLPIWLYVSVTGVAVYVMLYHVGPALR
jgi:putative membrane protein